MDASNKIDLNNIQISKLISGLHILRKLRIYFRKFDKVAQKAMFIAFSYNQTSNRNIGFWAN